MQSVKIAGLALASMLVLGMALAGNAAAGLLWLVCLEGAGLTKYENSKCLKASGTGKWQSVGVRAGQEITIKLLVATIALRDRNGGVGAGVECFDKGSRGEVILTGENTGKVRVFSYENAKENCKGIDGCEEVEEVVGINLPWGMEVVTGTNGKPLTRLSNGGGAGQPGWKIKCKILGVMAVDECVMSEASSEKEMVELLSEVTGTELLIRGRLEEVGVAKCTLTKERTGRMAGLFALLLPGGALSINPA